MVAPVEVWLKKSSDGSDTHRIRRHALSIPTPRWVGK